MKKTKLFFKPDFLKEFASLDNVSSYGLKLSNYADNN